MYKINALIKSGQQLFHTGDLGVLWRVQNKNTLYTTIKRYVQKGILLPVHKGLYASVPLSQVHPVRVGMAILHQYAYLSCESVLAKEGIITQAVYTVTLVSAVTRKFSVGKTSYTVRKLAPPYLYRTAGIQTRDGVFVATVARAVADMRYFSPNYHFDAPESIPEEMVKRIQKEVGYSY